MTANAERKQSYANLPVICTIFFLSGFPALIYQLVWQRSLFAIYGINIESVTVVVTAFMLGLGLGSLLGGMISRWRKLPLLTVFGVIELGIGVYGYFSLGIFDYVGEATLGAGVWATGVLTFLLVLVPTLLMGATLPILVAHLVRHSRSVGNAVGLMYFVNTLGSAAACFAVALFLMRTLGMQGVVTSAALMNLVVAAGAFVASIRSKTIPETTPDETPGAEFSRRRLTTAMILVGLTGFISLSYEIVWFRVFTFASAGSAMAFALLLGSFLGGIAFGSLFARRYCTRDTDGRGLRALALFVLLANVTGFAVAPLTSVGALFVHVYAMLPLIVIAAGMLGATFPLICHYGIAPDARAGSGVSYLYLTNIIGASAGSLVTGFVLMDFLTTAQITTGLAMLGFLLVALVTRLSDSRREAQVKQFGAAGVGAVLTVLVASVVFGGFWERLDPDVLRDEQDTLQHVVENRHGLITVTQDGRIYGNGVYDGVFSTDLVDDRNMIVRPYSMGAFHDDPREVLMIGLSSGSWAQVVAHHPDVEKLTIIEINPGYVDLIRQHDEISSLLDNPKVEIVIDDGRRWLNRNPDRQFDFIVMNTTYHWRAYTTNLLSGEFLQLIRKRLKPGGAALYNTTDSARAQRTACVVFPYVVRVINNVVVSDSRLIPDKTRWKQVLSNYEIDGVPVLDLDNPLHAERLEQTLALVDTITLNNPPGWGMETRRSILARTQGLRLYTDDNMGSEWDLRRNDD